MNGNFVPELIAPGGSYNKAMVAAHNGADAIYLGVPFTSLRMRQNKVSGFTELKRTIDDLHKLGKKAFLTMNIFPRNMDIKIFENVVEKISEVGADAIIFSDPGTYNIIKKYLPQTRLHLSTQTNVLNSEAVKFWEGLGVSRIVLARELTLKEIQQMRKDVPGMELEIFIHGAMCVTYSGRCLMGNYFSGRDANKGECSHVCRYKFKMYLEEEKRPGKFFEVGTDEEGGTYMLSSKDLCTIERIQEIIPHVHGLKIEGRSKGELYVGAVTKAYRHVIDSSVHNTPVNSAIKDLVYQIPHRQYWEGFLFRNLKAAPDGEEAIELQTDNDSISYQSAGPVIEKKYHGLILPQTYELNATTYNNFIPKENISVGDTLEFFSPDQLASVTVTGLLNDQKTPVDTVDCNMKSCFIATDKDLGGWEVLFK